MTSPKVKRIVLGVCGSIAAYKAADLIRRLQEHHWEVDVIMTREAMQFITPLTLASLSGRDVYGDMFEHNSGHMTHIELARRADAVLIAPATANIIGKLAAGLADDTLSAFVMTTRAPIFLAPAMNTAMYTNTIVQDNCAKLKKHGIKFIEPIKGKLACGDVGAGHLAEVDMIVKAVGVVAKW